MSDKEILLFSLLGFIAILLVIAIFLLVRRKNTNDLDLLQKELFNLTKSFNENNYKTNKIINDSLTKNLEINHKISENSNKTIEEITKKLTNLEETNKQIKDFSKQMQGLENILKNPKQRGILGEYFLETTLKNVLPPENYSLQYKFKSGEIVDGVIFLDNKIIPIDSKFSLENYNKILSAENKIQKDIYEKNFRNDLKNRIDETSKYIKPAEKTMDFAFMFIPSEAIYYDLLINKVGAIDAKDLVEYAFKQKKVIIVSPTSFYAYLQTVLQGLKALKIEQQAEEIRKQIGNLARHLKTYEQYFDKLGNSLNISTNHYENAKQEFRKIDKDILKIENQKQLKENQKQLK